MTAGRDGSQLIDVGGRATPCVGSPGARSIRGMLACTNGKFLFVKAKKVCWYLSKVIQSGTLKYSSGEPSEALQRRVSTGVTDMFGYR